MNNGHVTQDKCDISNKSSKAVMCDVWIEWNGTVVITCSKQSLGWKVVITCNNSITNVTKVVCTPLGALVWVRSENCAPLSCATNFKDVGLWNSGWACHYHLHHNHILRSRASHIWPPPLQLVLPMASPVLFTCKAYAHSWNHTIIQSMGVCTTCRPAGAY